MHDAARRFVAETVAAYGPFPTVIEIGGRDINGGVRDLFDGEYLSLDLVDGPGVDVVADACVWSPDRPVSCVVCCEVLEHSQAWDDLVEGAVEWLEPGGWLIVTCAGPGRAAHSAIDGDWLRDGEHYANIDPVDLRNLVEGFGCDVVELRTPPTDVQLVARKL